MMKLPPDSGYSGKPLMEKLGLKSGMKTYFRNLPGEYYSWLGKQKSKITPSPAPPWDFAHLFLNTIHELEEQLLFLRHHINPAGMIWISWYKKSAGMGSELTEDIIRDTALAIGLVDIKVCSVSTEWSALKLVIRKGLR